MAVVKIKEGGCYELLEVNAENSKTIAMYSFSHKDQHEALQRTLERRQRYFNDMSGTITLNSKQRIIDL